MISRLLVITKRICGKNVFILYTLIYFDVRRGKGNMVVNACYISNTGIVRRNNEDSILVNTVLISEADMEKAECTKIEGEKLLYIVADGMGGHQKGEVASRTVLDTFREKYGQIDKERIGDMIRLAKQSLNRLAEADPNSFGLGTTVAGVLFAGGNAFVFNCGDSRVYRMKDTELKRITRDDSFVQELVDAGVITEEEMRTHPQKNIITSAITGDLRSEIPSFSVREIKVVKGDRFLLCTDGIWESMGHDELEGCFLGNDLKRTVECLKRRTTENGARDNFSSIVLETG
jgi:serine/threonine protein phosphatase PrpC